MFTDLGSLPVCKLGNLLNQLLKLKLILIIESRFNSKHRELELIRFFSPHDHVEVPMLGRFNSKYRELDLILFLFPS